MLTFEVDHLESEADTERRSKLRTFLTKCRSQRAPTEFGLPCSGRRRVRGLRRGEVAEMIGVTVDWYRSFESGRPVRVSAQFVSRLIGALRFSDRGALTLYRFAIPEMYIAARRYEIAQRTRNLAPADESKIDGELYLAS
jgi:transcriptional regulator with XRE-family HTH domain